MFSVYQHWDPLRVCVVGRSYPPEFYSWITVPHVRSLFEKIAVETEEDYQNIIAKLHEFGVEVLRPNFPKQPKVNGIYLPPPMTPRDHTVMIGKTFYCDTPFNDFGHFYWNARQPGWPDCASASDIDNLPHDIKHKCQQLYQDYCADIDRTAEYSDILNRVRAENNTIKTIADQRINGAMVSRVGRDLFFGTHGYYEDTTEFKKFINEEFTNTRNHIINTGGHSDATYCPVCPGLIISLHDVPTYAETFPDWEVVYLPAQSWALVDPFLKLKEKNGGRWWIPGFEHDQAVVDTVEHWMKTWVGYVEETVFDVNMLIVDPKNVIVFNYNKQVFDALDRYGITPHVVPFRHRYFWDGGIHCCTSDLHRDGGVNDYFSHKD